MIVHETNYWFGGTALEVCNLSYYEENPTIQLEKIKADLNRFYGRFDNSVENLLDEILHGPEVQKNDINGLEYLLVALEKLQIHATQDDCDRKIDTVDVIHRIILLRVPFLTKPWVKKE